MKKLFWFFSIIILIIFTGCINRQIFPFTGKNQTKQNWQELQKGLSYATIAVSPIPPNARTGKDEEPAQDQKSTKKQAIQGAKEFVLVSIDPKLFELHVYTNKNESKAKSIQEIHKREKSLLTFNGTFFDEQFKPVGLLKDKDKILNRLSPSRLLNGVFVIGKENIPQLLNVAEYKSTENIHFALQNGPILIDPKGNIQVTVDTGKTASRTAIGLDKNGNIILILLKQTLLHSENALSLYQFAHFLKESPSLADLGLHSVLNLDGGPSTGMMVDNFYSPELNRVQNVVTLFNKTPK